MCHGLIARFKKKVTCWLGFKLAKLTDLEKIRERYPQDLWYNPLRHELMVVVLVRRSLLASILF